MAFVALHSSSVKSCHTVVLSIFTISLVLAQGGGNLVNKFGGVVELF